MRDSQQQAEAIVAEIRDRAERWQRKRMDETEAALARLQADPRTQALIAVHDAVAHLSSKDRLEIFAELLRDAALTFGADEEDADEEE